jgi:predicted acylesterase/phospholipase RssA
MSEVPEKKGKLSRVPSYRKLHFKDSPGTNKKLQMSFGGCGFLGVYHCGVGKCVVDHAPHLFSEFDGFYGASAGAITAVCAACRSDPMIAYKWVRKTFEDSRKHWFGMLSPFFDLYARLRIFLNGFIPQNAHKLCRNVVKISLTVVGDSGLLRNWLISDFRTRNELINVSVRCMQ